MLKQLVDLVPNYEDVLRLEPEQLAGILLEVLLPIDGADRQYLHRVQFFNQPGFFNGYPITHGSEIKQAVFEAWMWLEREGFLLPRLGDYTGWVDLSRRARKAAGREGVAAYRKTALLPFAELHPRISSSVYQSKAR